ncbi:PREDICTED: alpha-N-acetylgalactosaminidase-like isoform X2 [Branchiostoma belcheri]|uniref:Alpha-galactosidase n=1 Tax=Branchiostoma belcheri TaxID=7741 RepID=A0A6P4YLN8_BRABE|nr:PREDICTED: alpha-N-acetylgalactosaminidase-like isoform X2 [Branchiostoma belcheri]
MWKAVVTAAVALALLLCQSSSLDNGLARTPPMGWLAWERFRCNVDCVDDPYNCISEHLFMQMADRLAEDGWKDAGYDHITIDDCWMSMERDDQGNLYANKTRFPNGIKKLADYVHSKGLKLGIYLDFGTHTCGGYPGSIKYLQQDAETIAGWGIDLLKMDGCYANVSDMSWGYPDMEQYMNKTGRPILFSCSWPAYAGGIKVDYSSLEKHCNMWRNYDDIQDSWDSVTGIIDWYGDNQNILAPAAGPGHWNDPDMLIVGDYSLSYEESKAQMAMWAILAAPLFMSNDLRSISAEARSILMNKEVIRISQDSLGMQGRRIIKEHGIEVWTRVIENKDFPSYAVAFLNRRSDGMPYKYSLTLDKIGFEYYMGYELSEVFTNQHYGHYDLKRVLTLHINPSGVVMIYAIPMS